MKTIIVTTIVSLLMMSVAIQNVKAELSALDNAIKVEGLFRLLCNFEAHPISDPQSLKNGACPKAEKAHKDGTLQRGLDNETRTGKITTFKEILESIK